MPRYFFDVSENGSRYPDDEGSELFDIKRASAEAIGVLVDLARDRLPDGDRHEFVCEVRDESGEVILRQHLRSWRDP